tara:strand:+ start:649 stop:924 length:276 start_codon:yes stop_codon:yes gene_type:complete
MPTEDKNWHLSKTVPVSFILAIIGQTLALVWFVASMNSGIENNLRDLDRHEMRIAVLENTVQAQAVTMGRMDENIKAIRVAVESMAVGRTK